MTKLTEPSIPSVCVVMGTFNGEKFLKEQLDSIFNQVKVSIKLVVRDDGSGDGTVRILKSFERKGLLEFQVGKNLGFSENYIYLLQSVIEREWDYVAFSDQDDIWDRDKLSKAVERLRVDGFGMYASKRRIWNGLSIDGAIYPRGKIIPTFLNSCFENICAGCTIVMSRDFARFVLPYLKLPEARGIPFDSLLYSIAVAQDTLYFDNDSHIKYRLHANNTIGIEASKSVMFLLSIGNFTQALAKKLKFLAAGQPTYLSVHHQMQLNVIRQENCSLARTLKVLRMAKFRQRRLQSFFLKIFVAAVGPILIPKEK